MNLKGLFPRASKAFIDLNPDSPKLEAKKPQSVEGTSLGNGAQGKKQVLGRITIRYRGFFVRPQDTDNFAGATKPSTDFLRRVHLIDGDEPWKINLSWEQEKVARFEDERVEIKITWPNEALQKYAS